jgi:hypothetical protein
MVILFKEAELAPFSLLAERVSSLLVIPDIHFFMINCDTSLPRGVTIFGTDLSLPLGSDESSFLLGDDG